MSDDYARFHFYEVIAAALHDRGYFSVLPSHVQDIEREVVQGREPETAVGRVIAYALAQADSPARRRSELARAILETQGA